MPSATRHRRVGLGFDAAPQPFFKRDGGVPRHIGGLPVQILGGPGRLVQLTLDLLFDVASEAADAFLQLATEIAGGASYTVFVHKVLAKRLRGLVPLSASALQRKPYLNVPWVARFYPDRAAKEHSHDPLK